jgi:Mg-chelatase subunit ChlD
VFEVRVTKAGVVGDSAEGALHGRALWRPGQRDRLQVTLDGAAALAPVRLDLVFLVDATGSMADEIGKLRDSMRAMAAQIGALPSRPSICFGLVAYRDRGDDFFVRAQDFTDDLGAFQQGLAALHADGGGDMPEALNEALHTAVHRLSWRGGDATRLVVLVADAPPHLDYGSPWYDDDAQGAVARGIKLLTIGASGLDPSGEYIFRQLAQFTGGRFVFLTYADRRRPASGPGRETVHDVRDYSVETLDRLVVRLVREELARRPDA